MFLVTDTVMLLLSFTIEPLSIRSLAGRTDTVIFLLSRYHRTSMLLICSLAGGTSIVMLISLKVCSLDRRNCVVIFVTYFVS